MNIARVLLGLGLVLITLNSVVLSGQGSETSMVASSAVVRVRNDGGLDDVAVRTLRSMLSTELRKCGVRVVEETATDKPRVLELTMAGRLGSKLPMTLDEIRSDGSVARSVSLTAKDIEEADIVIPRLVQAIMEAKPVDRTASMATVTEGEGKAFNKRPGEGRWLVGLPHAAFKGDGEGGTAGFSMGYLYEAEHWHAGVEGFTVRSAGTRMSSPIFLFGAWIPLNGSVSPYLGGGIGNLSIHDEGTSFTDTLALRFSLGVELTRLHRLRVLAGADLYLPLGSPTAERRTFLYDPIQRTSVVRTQSVSRQSVYSTFHVKLAF